MLSEPTAVTSESPRFSRPFQWSLLALVIALLAVGIWLPKEMEPTVTPMEQPEEVWVRHDAVRELANQVGVRSRSSFPPLVPVKPTSVEPVVPQEEKTTPLAPPGFLPENPSQ